MFQFFSKRVVSTFLLIISFLIIFPAAKAKVIVVSDIDDTVKQSNVMELSDALVRVLRGVGSFEYLGLIYGQLRDFYQKDNQVNFIYVSASMKMVYNGEKWLSKYGFPIGKVSQRNSIDQVFIKSSKFKKIYVTKLLKSIDGYQTAKVIFFGDNGENDPIIYKDIVSSLGIKDALIYVRDVSTEATDFNIGLDHKRETGVNYFLSEYQLIKNRWFEFLSKDLVSRIVYNYCQNLLIPSYVQNHFVDRVIAKRCRKTDPEFFSCKFSTRVDAEKIWSEKIKRDCL